jgi:hypothetical protein
MGSVWQPRLTRVLRGDLDNIVAKALKKNPLERYASVREFADDLRRYLNNEPVLARADNAWYRVRKFVARNRLPVGIAAIALAGIIATAAVALMEAHQAALGRDRALMLSSRNEAVADFLQTLITEAASSEKPVSVKVIGAGHMPPALAARCLGYMGQTLLQNNDGEEALKYLKLGLDELRKEDHPSAQQLATALSMIGHGEYLQGQRCRQPILQAGDVRAATQGPRPRLAGGNTAQQLANCRHWQQQGCPHQ